LYAVRQFRRKSFFFGVNIGFESSIMKKLLESQKHINMHTLILTDLGITTDPEKCVTSPGPCISTLLARQLSTERQARDKLQWPKPLITLRKSSGNQANGKCISCPIETKGCTPPKNHRLRRLFRETAHLAIRQTPAGQDVFVMHFAV